MKKEEVVVMDKKEQYIKEKTEDLIIDMLDTKFENADRDEFEMKLQATRTAMVHLRDREMMRRINQGQQIRVFNIIANTPEERKQYIELSMPALIPKK